MRPDFEVADIFLMAPTLQQRAWALVRFLAFAALSAFLFVVALLLIAMLLITPVGLPLQWILALQVPTEIFAALSATALMARWGRRRLASFGWAGHDRLCHLLVGTGTGLVLVTLMVLIMCSASAMSFEDIDAGPPAVRSGIFYALLMFGVAVAEEGLFRGYALVALSQSISFWPAALATSMLFGLMHLVNGGESATGIASAMLFGMALSYSYRRTGTLWFACGLHGGWDYAQSFIFGVPNSGTTLPGALIRSRIDGPSWLTGGSAGPEGSVLMVIAFLAMLFVIQKLPRRSATANEFDITRFSADSIGRS
jgi:membrane protease YdiL (CAAX protease family)